MLLPVLYRAAANGVSCRLITRPEWAVAFRPLCPWVTFAPFDEAPEVDLDAATQGLKPQSHRTLEFGKILGVEGPFQPVRFDVPENWTLPFRSYSDAVLLGPEAGHPARAWSELRVHELCRYLEEHSLVLVGLHRESSMLCKYDLRGQLSLKQLLGLTSVAGRVICLDSGLLQVAMAIGVPTLALFGGVDPRYRIFPQQKARVLRAALNCSPCNKQETCRGAYFCTRELSSERVLEGLEGLEYLSALEILDVAVGS